MKTAEVLDKYRKILSGILKCDPENILLYIRKSGNWSDVGHFDYDKKTISQHWELGEYRVTQKIGVVEVEISTFKLYQLQHCCAFMVSCNALVREKYRGKRIGTILNQLRQDIGRLLGYSAIICTDIDKNTPQRKLLATNGWKDVYSVLNKRTKNLVHLAVINL